MLNNHRSIIDHTIDHFEGGDKYTNIKDDLGGATKFGITRATLASWRGRPCSNEDVASLTRLEAFKIYHQVFYNRPGITRLPSCIQYLTFDMCVNHGAKNAGRIVQRALVDLKTLAGGDVDGVMGPYTAACAFDAMHKHGEKALLDAVIARRGDFYKQIVERNPSQKKFEKGWGNRLDWFRKNQHLLLTPKKVDSPAILSDNKDKVGKAPDGGTGLLAKLLSFFTRGK